MKTVKKSISLPGDLFEFAEKQAKSDSKESGSTRVNISAYLRKLLAKAKRENEMKQAA